MELELFIQNGDSIYSPETEEGVTWDTERKNTPGKLTFSVIKDDVLNFQEGNPVRLTVDGQNVFYGFVFSKKRSKDGSIQVTAYDQLRYLKNKETINLEGIKASELLQLLAEDYRLNCGIIEDTGYKLESIVEEDQSLFDIIQNAMDETLQATGVLYVLYDDFGKLTLKNIQSLKTDFIIDQETAEDFDYSSSIDGETYNKVKLAFENEDTGKRENYIVQDGEHINQWGVLQYYETIQSDIGAAAKAEGLLSLYNQKERKLTVKNVFGDPRIRAGVSVIVNLNLGDIIAQNYMVVEKAKHTWKGNEYFMDLTLIGGTFIA